MTDDFPEFTGRVCPALCEKGCVLNKQHEPVTIRENEAAIVERAFSEGYVIARPPKNAQNTVSRLSAQVLPASHVPISLTVVAIM